VASTNATNDSQWTLLTGNYTPTNQDDLFVFVKGPNVGNGVVSDFYIDDFSLVTQGSAEVDFSNVDDIVDIGAFEFLNATAGVNETTTQFSPAFLYPNPAKNQISISKYTANDLVDVMDLLGKNYHLPKRENTEQQILTLDVSSLSNGVYLLKIRNSNTNTFQTLKFLKN
jgi:hypothetical protein